MKKITCASLLLSGLVVISPNLWAVGVYPFSICTESHAQEWARVSGHNVVWIESRNDTNGKNRDVYGYNLVTQTEFPICSNPSNQAYLAGLDISGNTVVYHSAITPYYPDIYAFTLPDGPEFLAASHQGWDPATKPRIDGDLVVWLNWKSVYARRLGGAVVPVSTRSCDNPDVSGHIIVWQEWHESSHYDILGYDFDTQATFVICDYHSGNPNTSYKTNPAISGNIVVWQDPRGNDGASDIYGKNLATGEEFPICTHTGFQLKPDISGNVVVWVDNRVDGLGQGVYGKNLLTGEEFFIVSSTAVGTVSIDRNIVVWDSWLDIYGAYLTNADLNNDNKVDLADFGLMSMGWGLDSCRMPDYCGNLDLNLNGVVGLEDLDIMASFWLFGMDETGE